MIADKPIADAASHECLEWTATDALRHIQQGSITAERYASELLKRHRETKALNAFISLDEQMVLERAKAVDVDRAAGKALGPLAGLPIAIKDNIHTVGFPTTTGTSALKDYFPKTNARIVDILFQNGAILLGKANMDELGREFTNSNTVYGFARNPYDTSRVPGGGAGGTAVAIAARVTPAGLGSDTAGSARIPASYCGIAGLRPSTAGRLRGWTTASWMATSLEDGMVPISFAVSTTGPMGRTVSDVALLHAVVTGTPMPSPMPLRGVRLGVPRGYFWEDVDPEVIRVSERALDRIRHAGATLVEVNLRQWAQTAGPTFQAIATLHAMQDLGDFLERNGAGVSLDQVIASLKNKAVQARALNTLAHPITPEQAEAATKTRIRLALEYAELFRRERIAAIVYPTVAILPPPIRPQGDDITDTADLNGKPVPQFAISLRNTCAAGVIGVPALNIPAGLTASGLPVGISVSGVADGDSALLSLALSLETACGRLPAPVVRLDQSAGQVNSGNRSMPFVATTADTRVPATAHPPTSAIGDSDLIVTLLKQSAYLNLSGAFDTPNPDRAGTFTATAALRRYDVDFRINGCEAGLGAVNLVGDECGRASLRWTFGPAVSGSASAGRPFTLDDRFVFDDQGHNQLQAAGWGRLVPSLFSDGIVGVEAHGNIVTGTGVFAGVQGSYALTGYGDTVGLKVRLTIRLIDPTGAYQTTSELSRLDGTPPGDRLLTSLAFLGERDPDHAVELRPTGAIVHQLLRAVHTDFDRGRGHDRLRSAISLGPIVARWRSEVVFNPADPAAPGTADRPMPVRVNNVNITFLHGPAETLEASITDGFGFAMTLPGVPGRLFRMSGFGPIAAGTGRFRSARGTLSMLGALGLAPAAFSNYYVLTVADPSGSFRC